MNRAPASRDRPRSGVPSAQARRWSWPQISLWTRQVTRPRPTVVTVQLDVKDLDVMLFDLVAHLFDRSGVILHHLDVLEWRAAGLFLGLRMHGPQAPDIDDQLLAFRSETVSRKQFGSIRIWRGFEHAGRADDQRGAFGGIDRRNRSTLLANLEDIVLVAIGHHRPLAERETLRRIGR